MAADEGQAFWFLNTLTIIKVGSDDSQAHLSVLEHRVPPGFAPPPHVHLHSDEAFLIQDGEYSGFCAARPDAAYPRAHSGHARTSSWDSRARWGEKRRVRTRSLPGRGVMPCAAPSAAVGSGIGLCAVGYADSLAPGRPLRFAFADPPYPGRAWRWTARPFRW